MGSNRINCPTQRARILALGTSPLIKHAYLRLELKMTDEHEVSAAFTADPADLARTIVRQPGMYMGEAGCRCRPRIRRWSRAGRAHGPRHLPVERGRPPTRTRPPGGDCSEAIWEFEPMLVALLTEIKNSTS